MLIALDHTEDIASNIKTFWFKPPKKVDFLAGQFIEMYLPHNNADERGQKHWFTLSSSPSEDLISITTKHATGQVSTFKQVLFELKPGTEIKISEPMGDFVLPKDKTIPLLFVVGGIGVTPVRSIVKWLLDVHEKRRLKILYGVSKLDEVAFKSLFETYGAKLQITQEHLSADKILKFSGTNTDPLIFVSGPEPMVEVLEAELLAAGVPKNKLVLDFFPGYPIP